MALQLVAQKTNFEVFYDPAVAGAKKEAIALAETCDQDFLRLAHLMGSPESPYGPTNRISLRVLGTLGPGAPSGATALNNGFATGNASQILILAQPALPDDVIRANCIAELTEIFNDQMNRAGTGGWPEGTGFSEGISLAMTAELYPQAYYAYVSGIRVNAWLKTSRDDRVSVTTPSENDPIADGCALLCLNYLRYQRNHTWREIVAHGGATLADTAEKLHDSFLRFRELIEKHIAPGKGIETENPFPLLDPSDRHIELSFEQQPVGNPSTASQGIVDVRPFVTCPVKSYSYSIVEQRQRLRCVATYQGFADSQAQWIVNGHPIPQVGSGAGFPIEVTVANEEPGNPGHLSYAKETVMLVPAGEPKRIDGYDAVRSELTFECEGTPGRFLLDIRVQGYELLDPASRTEASGVATLETAKLVREEDFYLDKARCEKHFLATIGENFPWKDIPIFKTLPDPPPSWLEALRWFELVQLALIKIAVTQPLVAIEMAGAMAAVFGIQPHSLLAAAEEG